MVVGYQKYCKCSCAGNKVVAEIEDCLLCTKDWCLQQKADLCGETKEVMAILCFQRESGKEFFIVLLFLLLVLGLLAYKLIKSFQR